MDGGVRRGTDVAHRARARRARRARRPAGAVGPGVRRRGGRAPRARPPATRRSRSAMTLLGTAGATEDVGAVAPSSVATSRRAPRSPTSYFSAIGLRLSFIVGVSSSPPGTQSPSTMWNFLICSTRESFVVGRVDLGLHRLADLVVVGERLERRVVDAVLLRPRGRAVGVEHDQRGVVGARVADDGGLADQRPGALELGLDVRRRHVLAGGVDDELLLAVDDLEVAVVVDLADVAGVQPAVVVERLARSCRGGCGSRA